MLSEQFCWSLTTLHSVLLPFDALTVLDENIRTLCKVCSPMRGSTAEMPLRSMRASTAADVATMPTPLQAPHCMLRTGSPAQMPWLLYKAQCSGIPLKMILFFLGLHMPYFCV